MGQEYEHEHEHEHEYEHEHEHEYEYDLEHELDEKMLPMKMLPAKMLSVTMLSVTVLFGLSGELSAHEPTWVRFLRRQAAEQQQSAPHSEAAPHEDRDACRLTLRTLILPDGTRPPVLVRVKNTASGKYVQLSGEIPRPQHWHVVADQTTVRTPRQPLQVEAIYGLETERTVVTVDARRESAAAELQLKRFDHAAQRNWHSGNTHLHLKQLSMPEAIRYLELTPQADDLDLLFISYLLRAGDDQHYVTNQLTDADLQRLSRGPVQMGNGEEHRHNFAGFGEGYGHVMFLNLKRLIEPVSIGPGIMQKGTDGRPLRTGIRAARDDGATVIWCHNRFGVEDVPNWLQQLVDAQNIFDGGDHGGYDQSFYRYLNLGIPVPFSTGTDWFIYDFSRVYVPLAKGEALTASPWLRQLARGRSFITNGPLLELTVDDRPIGARLECDAATTVRVRARGAGRVDFGGLELICNGRVVAVTGTRQAGGHHSAELDLPLSVDTSSWIAVRIPERPAAASELGGRLFGHTSPVYIQIAGKRQFDHGLAAELDREMVAAMQSVQKHGVFRDDAELQQVLQVYRDGRQHLAQLVESNR